MTMTEQRAKLTSAERDALPDSAFALPGRRYPIHDENHARAALSEVAQHGTAEEKAKVRAAVHKRYPHIGVDGSHSAQRDPAWQQRRKRWANSLVGQEARRSMQLARGNVEVRAKADGTGGTNFEFRGYAATFLDPFDMWDKWGDPYVEDVLPGGFSETLGRPDLDTPFLIGHNEAGIPMARTRSGTMKLAEDSHGLDTYALLSGKRQDVRDLADAVERGDMDEMSIGFITRGQEWSPDYSQRHLTNLDLHRGDVSVVALAANPATRGITMLPTEILSRQAAEKRAAMNQAATTDAPSSDHMQPMVGPTHGEFTGEHVHGHDAFGRSDADSNGEHGHPHFHNADNVHNHLHMEAQEGTDATYSAGPAGMTDSDADRGSARPLERRGNPVDQDMGNGPNYSADGQVKCTNADCAHTADYQPPAAKFCSYCGDALVRIGADGMPPMEEEQGAAASLALRRRRLELLALAR